MLGAAGCWKGTGSKRSRLNVDWYLKTQDTCPSIFSRHQCKQWQLLRSYPEMLCLGECWWHGRKDCSDTAASGSEPQAQRCGLSAREKDFHSWLQQLLSHRVLAASAGSNAEPAATTTPGWQCHEQAPTRQSSHNPGAGTASLQPSRERSAHSPRLLPLQKAPSPSPLANEMLQHCLSKEYLHKKTLISANYQAHAAIATRNDIKMLCYAMHHDKDSFNLKTKTEERGNMAFCKEPLALRSNP